MFQEDRENTAKISVITANANALVLSAFADQNPVGSGD
jgi:hypothetical protein